MGDPVSLFSRIIMLLVPLILALTVHEYAHALAARLLGDDTAEREGRMTLNPLSHIDPVGTLLLPVILAVTNAPFGFGWAKPVPFNPTRFRRDINMRTGTMLVAIAGPLSNLALALVLAAVVKMGISSGWFSRAVIDLFPRFIILNLALFVFNMIPVYPLDGQKVLVGFLPYNNAMKFERFSMQYGSWLLMGVIFFGGRVISPPLLFLYGGILSLFGLN